MPGRQAIKMDQNYFKGYLRAGTALLRLNRPHEALDAFKRACQLSTESKAAQVCQHHCVGFICVCLHLLNALQA